MSPQPLGRGLDALLSRKSAASSAPQSIPVATTDEKIVELPIHVIKTAPDQPRKIFDNVSLAELAQSIREYGILQPLVVTRSGNDYFLVAGERRLRAAQSIGLAVVPVVIRQTGDHERLAVALIENIQRVDLNPMELADAYRQLIGEFNITHQQLADKLGKSRPWISNMLRLHNLIPEAKEALRDGRIDTTRAKLIVALNDPVEQMKLFRSIIDENLDFRETYRRLRKMSVRHAQMAGAKAPALVRKEELLREYLGARATINARGGKGHLVIDFFSEDELDDIIRKILD